MIAGEVQVTQKASIKPTETHPHSMHTKMTQKNQIECPPSSKLSAFFIALLILLALHQIHNVQHFPWDAKGYWELSDPKTFFNYPKAIRGYFYPLLLLPAHYFSNLLENYQNYSYRFLSALVYAYALTIVLPQFYVRVFGGKLTTSRRLIIPFLIATLFPGLIIYPLSDLPAFLLLIGSIGALLNAKTATSRTTAAALAVLGGMLAAGAYNTRTIYLFPLLCIFCAIPLYFFSAQPTKNRFLGILAFVSGLLLVSLPQSFINQSRHETWSPAVISQKTERSLFALQLMWGITIQRYETTIDPTSPSPSRYFMDKAGEKLFTSESLERDEVTVANYISLVARRPLDFLGIYGRHLVNGLDLRDGEVYVKNSNWVHNKIAALNFFVLTLGFLSALVRYDGWKSKEQPSSATAAMSRAHADTIWPLCAFLLLLPVAAILPGAIETRFFLPLHVLLYCTIAFNASATEITLYMKKHWIPVLLGAGFLCLIFFAVSTNTMSSMQPFIHPQYRFWQ
jgi:hypothetical protein